jgi:hypothetical protein
VRAARVANGERRRRHRLPRRAVGAIDAIDAVGSLRPGRATRSNDEVFAIFQATLTFTGTGDFCQPFIVPNPRGVIQTVTAGGLSGYAPLVRLYVHSYGQPQTHFIETSWQPGTIQGNRVAAYFTGTHSTRFYADGGTHQVCVALGGGGSGQVSLIGVPRA